MGGGAEGAWESQVQVERGVRDDAFTDLHNESTYVCVSSQSYLKVSQDFISVFCLEINKSTVNHSFVLLIIIFFIFVFVIILCLSISCFIFTD